MKAAKKSQLKTQSLSAATREDGRDGTGEDGADSKTEEVLAEKHDELDKVLDRHDTLVREVFHLEKFVTLLSYDPKVAKEDGSAAFREYKSEYYDIFQNVASSSAAGPSRKTRGARHARIQNLTALSSTMSTASDPRPRSNSLTQPTSTPALSAKAKGKQKAVEPISISAFTPNGHGNSRSRPGPPRQTLPKGTLDHPPSESMSAPPGHLRKRTTLDVQTPDQPPILRKKRKLRTPSPSPPPPDDDGEPELSPGCSSRRQRRTSSVAELPPQRSRPTTPLRRRVTIADLPEVLESPLPSSLKSVKRVKLIVRRPPPMYSSPHQIAPPPKFGSSINAFLNSYVSVDGEESKKKLEKKANEQAEFLARVDTLRRQGRIMLDSRSIALLQDQDKDALLAPPKTHPRGVDIWDHVLQEVAQRSNRNLGRGRTVCSQIASKINVYWEQSALREDRARAKEEKRLRALAKATIKMVMVEWKKAVHYIREQERFKAEEEERRKGHEHLDAILNQSGHILESQHLELARGDSRRSSSRASSLGDAMESWGDESGLEEEEEEENDGAAEEDIRRMGGRDSDDESRADENEGEDSGSEEGEDVNTLELLGVRDLPRDEDERRLMVSSIDEEMNMKSRIEEEDTSVHHSPNAAVTASRSPSALFDTHISSPQPSRWSSAEHVQTPTPTRASPPSSPIVSSPSPTHADDKPNIVLGLVSYSSSTSPSPVASPSRAVHEIGSPQARASPSSSLAYPSSPSPEEDKVDDTMDIDSNVESISTPQDVPAPEPGVVEDAEHDPMTRTVPIMSREDDIQVTKIQGEAPTRLVSPDTRETSHVQPDDDEAASDVAEEQLVGDPEDHIPTYLKPFAVAPVDWDPDSKVTAPLLLRGVLRPYQQSGLEWLASLHSNHLNGILADEMGLGKTIQTISLLAHLACDRGIWGPHLIIVPTSVLLNWEMEFKKFLPGFKILSYHGSTKRRKELRQGWNNKHSFNVCVTSYTLASRDAHIFKRKPWYYMILDEAHMIKNFKSQRWNILLMFRSFRRLLLTGTPLQNNLTELWALLQFLMSGTNFANLKEFGDWFSNPLEKAIEMGSALDDENIQRVSKLHTVLRPYLLRRLKRDVEKELPSKYEHLVLCPLSKRQRFLYDEFMTRAHTQEALQSGVYQKIANILMQLRKVCNHPDLFEVRPIVTSFAMTRSAVVDYEIKELLVRRRLLQQQDNDDEQKVNLGFLGLRFVEHQDVSVFASSETTRLDATLRLPFLSELPGPRPPKDTRTIEGYKLYRAYQLRAERASRWAHVGYMNTIRCRREPIYNSEAIATYKRFYRPLVPLAAANLRHQYWDTVTRTHAAIKTYEERAEDMRDVVERFAFVTPSVVAQDVARFCVPELEDPSISLPPGFDSLLHHTRVKLQIAFPDPLLLQYDCGKLQMLSRLLRDKKAGGHRVLIFTQMTRILDILEMFLNFHGHLYLRLDGATKIEDRQYITERFNADPRIFCFIASSRSGGVGINLTGADTVIFYDSDFNPQMDRQCEDRAHRIGQMRDVHIYRFISSHTVEEAMLMKANQKRSLDDIVIQKGEFDWRTLFDDQGALTKALGEFEDTEDARAAAIAASEENVLVGADEADFGAEMEAEERAEHGPEAASSETPSARPSKAVTPTVEDDHGYEAVADADVALEDGGEDGEGEGGSTADFMLGFVQFDYDFFRDWRL
ncbi:hypothetical protein CONPUDRAFT_166022 [Coniophora puteana RWD-64-598 SS2]|uniref:Helicase SWR1 n=1 Tax=Coniophora puteana (strain RWD-64-598) TaxID=741705 RepID=A0A5M3MNA2_CONPW|nr:uncharacterized protein CONPUDRAFT_166022 [Coniophora puteana RWD-64-598 SS2]EIW80516.1 hypothetical protein CONPUDRAFT_166022 [Coniophora puteana RWD-64-598 SS2]